MQKKWSRLWLVSASFTFGIGTGTLAYFFCTDFLSQALWERAHQIVSDEVATQPVDSETKMRESFARSSIVVANRMVTATGWAIACGAIVFLLLLYFSEKESLSGAETAKGPAFNDEFRSIRFDFSALADELSKTKPPKTKTDWETEIAMLSGQVEAYRNIALRKLQASKQRIDGNSSELADFRADIIKTCDEIHVKLSEDRGDLDHQIKQLRAAAGLAYELSRTDQKS